MKRATWFVIGAVVVGLAACGGKSKGGDTTPDEGTADEGGGETQAADEDSAMIPPERMDEIQSTLDRKRDSASRCLTSAIDEGEAPKNAHGKVMLEFVIGTDGHAKDIKVAKTSIESEKVSSCLVELVGKIDFGPLPRDLDWSYPFAFEAF